MSSGYEIGLRISRLRGEQSQQEVANALKIRRETVTQWENGTRRIKDTDIIRLADYFGCSCDSILRGIDSQNLDIHRETGLSDRTINTLRYLNDLRRLSESEETSTVFDNLFPLLDSIITDAFQDLILCSLQANASAEAMLTGSHLVKSETSLEELASFYVDNENMKQRGRLVVEPRDMVILRAQQLADTVKQIVIRFYEQMLENKRNSMKGGSPHAQSSENQ